VKNTTARLFRALLGLVICVVGAGTALIAIILTLEYAWGWIFLVGPLALLGAALLIRWGSRLISQ
jgi:putative Ca2+/H+ antiporter (TMEM165/GDT1 family)